MLVIRRSEDRGHVNHGWLDAHHSFSFASYHDPAHMGFRALRVINEDRVEPGEGFGTHPHRDMEIITYILEGSLAHKDSMGNGSTIYEGEFQQMSAGTGVQHSEFNASKEESVHLLQIWIVPKTHGVKPSYSEWKPDKILPNAWTLVASEGGVQGTMPIHQDAKLYLAKCERDTTLDVPIDYGRYGWIQVAKGSLGIGEEEMQAGDGASFASGDVTGLRVAAGSEVLLFDLA